MELLTFIYLGFILVSLYVSFLFLLLFFKNREELFKNKLISELPSLSVLIPAYNEEETIAGTIEAVLKADYPKKLFEVIVIDDGSTDRTAEIARQFKGVKLFSKENSGKADSLNKALKIAKGELVAVVDADSYPVEDAFMKMVGYFKDEKMGAVTSAIFVKNQSRFFEKLQAIEYAIIAWARKLLDFVGSVYVTPGALSIYRRKVLLKLGGFDKENLTEDIEIAWRLLKNKYKISMCLSARVYTVSPSTFRKWWKQRLRWNTGGVQTVYKYKYALLRSKYGMLGAFITPFFLGSIILSLTGFSVFVYLIGRKLLGWFLITKDSYLANAPMFDLSRFYIMPSVFTFFVLMLFLISLIYVVYGLKTVKKIKFDLKNKFYILVYLLLYLVLYPPVLISAIFKLLVMRNLKW